MTTRASGNDGIVKVRLDRTNLMAYHDSAGHVKQGTSVSDWEKRRAEIVSGMTEVMGPVPEESRRVPLNVNVVEEVDCTTYIRRRITYQSEPGSTTSAFLLIPKSALKPGTKLPALLALHSTNLEIGFEVVVGLGSGENRDHGHQLAQRGFVVLAPSYPQMAKYQPDLKRLGYASGTMKAIWDNMRGLDLLDSLPYVDHQNYGAIGHSLGGHNAIFTAVMDKRIKVVVSSCGFDSFLNYMNGDLSGWLQERYMPRLANYEPDKIPFDFHELIAALAPRVIFVSAPKADANFQWQSVKKITDAARPVFALFGAEDHLIVKHPDCEHDFPDEVKEPAFQTLEKHLKRGGI